MRLMDEVQKLFDRVVRERFKDYAIQSVTAVRDTDYEDDDVFRVTVVFDHKGPLDPHKSAGLVRHLRHALMAELQDNTFPIVAFVSKSDAARMGTEAA
jgi:hypothetical protein